MDRKKSQIKREKGSSLSEKVEILREDSVDRDFAHEHLKHFFSNFETNLILGNFDLSTPEKAKEALKTLDETNDRIEKQKYLIQTLKKLLQSQ